jgi:hypothetical protein
MKKLKIFNLIIILLISLVKIFFKNFNNFLKNELSITSHSAILFVYLFVILFIFYLVKNEKLNFLIYLITFFNIFVFVYLIYNFIW